MSANGRVIDTCKRNRQPGAVDFHRSIIRKIGKVGRASLIKAGWTIGVIRVQICTKKVELPSETFYFGHILYDTPTAHYILT
jgi:hypothetical protein